jgi:carbon-monoxide dehydrogenase large subunit
MVEVMPPQLRREAQVGKRVGRHEDAQLLRGYARFLDDIEPAHALHMAVGRSPFPHARIVSVNVSEAAAIDGVEHILVGSEVAHCTKPLTRLRPIKEVPLLSYWAMAPDVALFEGQPIVSVAATSRRVAEDALELIDIDYEPIEQRVDVRGAVSADAPVLHSGAKGNLLATTTRRTGDPQLALALCDVVIEDTFEINRVIALPMEGRGIIAEFVPGSGELLVQVSSQVPHLVRKQLAEILDLDEAKVRVQSPHVGGGFGLKLGVYPEDLIASLHSMATRRPVKWVEDRIEHFRSSTHAREARHVAKLGATRDGKVQVLTDTLTIDMGAYHSPFGPPSSATVTLTGPYLVESCYAERQIVATNKAPVGAYRGYGAPESNFVCELLMERMARELGIDPLQFRLQNMIRPEQLPFETPSGAIYDGGDYPACLQLAADAIGYDRLRTRNRVPDGNGRLRGVGLAAFIEKTGYPSSKWLGKEGAAFGAYESVTLRGTRSGTIDCYTGITHFGQGGATALAQVVAEVMGVGYSQVHVHAGDTGASPGGSGSFSSRTMIANAGAGQQAAQQLSQQVLAIAAHLMGVESTQNLVISGQEVVDLVGSVEPIPLATVFQNAISGHDLPQGTEPGLEATAYFDPQASAYGSGAAACVVAVDPTTGEFEIERFVLTHDCGTQVNPTLVDGQVDGGLAQAFGAALMEELLYDPDSGQLINGTMMDYFAPSAADLPDWELEHLETPSPVTPLGVRGVGEAGTIPPAAAIANAISDALRDYNVSISRLPITPERVWRAIVDGQESGK